MAQKKPSEETPEPLSREEEIALLHTAGVPPEVVPPEVVLGVVEADNYHRAAPTPED